MNVGWKTGFEEPNINKSQGALRNAIYKWWTKTVNKYAKIEHTICKCANLNEEEKLKLAKWKTYFRLIFNKCIFRDRFQRPRGLRCGEATAGFLGLLVRFLPKARISLLVSVVCYQVEVSTTGRTLVQRSPTECECLCHWVWSGVTITFYKYHE